MNPHMCAKFGANRSIRLADFPHFPFMTPQNPPNSPWVTRGKILFCPLPFLGESACVCAKFAPDRTTDGDVYTLGRIHTQTHTHTLLYRYRWRSEGLAKHEIDNEELYLNGNKKVTEKDFSTRPFIYEW